MLLKLLFGSLFLCISGLFFLVALLFLGGGK